MRVCGGVVHPLTWIWEKRLLRAGGRRNGPRRHAASSTRDTSPQARAWRLKRRGAKTTHGAWTRTPLPTRIGKSWKGAKG